MMICYLCSSGNILKTNSQRRIRYGTQLYSFYFCKDCYGYSLFPKLSDQQIQRLYSISYVTDLNDENDSEEYADWNKFLQLKHFLSTKMDKSGGTFLDYGCGADPVTFEIARSSGLNPFGMEYSRDIQKLVMKETGVQVYSKDEILNSKHEYDVIFLGDVLEHLVNPMTDLRALLSKLKKDGILIAQGPLQGAWTFTHFIVIFFALLTKSRVSHFPPYHVSLANRKSMQELLRKAGFADIKIECTEVTWPAPNFKTFVKKPSPRSFLLFTSKVLDKIIARLVKNYGSRYFLVCKLEPHVSREII